MPTVFSKHNATNRNMVSNMKNKFSSRENNIPLAIRRMIFFMKNSFALSDKEEVFHEVRAGAVFVFSAKEYYYSGDCFMPMVYMVRKYSSEAQYDEKKLNWNLTEHHHELMVHYMKQVLRMPDQIEPVVIRGRSWAIAYDKAYYETCRVVDHQVVLIGKRTPGKFNNHPGDSIIPNYVPGGEIPHPTLKAETKEIFEMMNTKNEMLEYQKSLSLPWYQPPMPPRNVFLTIYDFDEFQKKRELIQQIAIYEARCEAMRKLMPQNISFEVFVKNSLRREPFSAKSNEAIEVHNARKSAKQIIFNVWISKNQHLFNRLRYNVYAKFDGESSFSVDFGSYKQSEGVREMCKLEKTDFKEAD